MQTGRHLKRWMPITRWLPAYRRADLGSDLTAGITVAVMLVPQAMAYAMLAGLPPIVGLYASTVPLFVYALFGTSRQLAVGPVAMDSLLVATSVGAIAQAGTTEYIAYALILMLMVGVLQLALGLARAGFVVNFLSHPVVSGFTSAAALIIGSSQLKHLLGLELPRTAAVHETLAAVARSLGDVHGPTVIIGAGAIAIILALRRFAPRVPSALAAVVIGTLAVIALDLGAGGVAIIGAVPGGLPPLSVPAVDASTLTTLLPAALTIALVGFMEAISVGQFFARKHRERIDPNQELVALGLANVGGAFFSGYPVTGGLSRTAVNDQAGARSGLASLVTAALIVLTLLFLTPLFYSMPKAALAAIIMVAVTRLFDVSQVKHLWRTDRVDLGLLLVTFAATLAISIEMGILIGVGASLVVFVAQRTRPHYAVLGRLPGYDEPVWRNVLNFPEAAPEPGVLALRFDASFYFGNVRYLQQRIEDEARCAAGPLRGIVLNMNAVNAVDSSASAMLVDLTDALAERGITVHLAAVKGPIRQVIARTRPLATRFVDRVFLTTEQAVTALHPAETETETETEQELPHGT